MAVHSVLRRVFNAADSKARGNTLFTYFIFDTAIKLWLIFLKTGTMLLAWTTISQHCTAQGVEICAVEKGFTADSTAIPQLKLRYCANSA